MRNTIAVRTTMLRSEQRSETVEQRVLSKVDAAMMLLSALPMLLVAAYLAVIL